MSLLRSDGERVVTRGLHNSALGVGLVRLRAVVGDLFPGLLNVQMYQFLTKCIIHLISNKCTPESVNLRRECLLTRDLQCPKSGFRQSTIE